MYFLFDLNSLGLNTYCIKSIILVEWDIICSSWQMSSIYFQMVSAEKFRGATSSVLNYVCAVAIIQWIKGGSFSIDKKRFWRTCFKSVACLISFYLTYPMFFPYFAVNSISVSAIPCQIKKPNNQFLSFHVFTEFWNAESHTIIKVCSDKHWETLEVGVSRTC